MMTWHEERTIGEDEWTREYVRDVLASRTPTRPPQELQLGDCVGRWREIEPGVVFIRTAGGTPDDRVLVESYLREWLRGCGYHQAQYTFYRHQKVADWDDIMAKARRLIQSGNVQLLRNGAQNIVGYVVGDHGEYQTEISREDPSSQTITQWECECPWDDYAWQRTRQWKKYEGRPCAHILATYWESQRTPLDEEASPQMAMPGQQPTLFDPGTAQPAQPGRAPRTQPGLPPQAPVPQLSIPGVSVPAPGPEPAPGSGIIPESPMMPAQPPAVSVPGGNPGGPGDPIQHPGGTFSRVAEWDFTQEEEQPGGWKWVHNSDSGQTYIGDHTTYHHTLRLQGEGRFFDNASGTVTPDGLVNVYTGTPSSKLFTDLHAAGVPNPRFPETPEESARANDHMWRIAADNFENSDMVRIEQDEWGTAEGKSELHGAGQPKLIPKGSIGEVISQDPTTGWVDVIFAGPQEQAGPMEPYHVQAWVDAGILTPMPQIRKPGPFIRRKR